MCYVILVLVSTIFSSYAMDLVQTQLSASTSHELGTSGIFDEAPIKFPLHEAAFNGNLALVKKLFETQPKKFTTQSLNEHHETPLHCAAAGGHLPVVKYLMEEKFAYALVSDELDFSPLHKAAENGHLSVIEYFLSKARYLVNFVSKDKISSLMLAARYGHANVAKILCKSGAFVNKGNDYNATALHMAVTSGSPETVALLLSNGASVNVISTDGKQTPLQMAELKTRAYKNHPLGENFKNIYTLLQEAANIQ